MERIDEDEIVRLEGDLGIPRGFFDSLVKSDDWSFIIKLHAFLEGAVTYLLTEKLDYPNLETVLSHLEMSNNKTGKLAFLSGLNLLNKNCYRYIKSLSELRNQLVHNISNVNFDLKSHVEKFDNQQISSFAKSFMPHLGGDLGKDDIHFAREEPKRYLWIGATYVLTLIYNLRNTSFYEKEIQKIKALSNK